MAPRRKWVAANKFSEKYQNILEKQENPEIGTDLLKKTKKGGIATLTKEEAHVFWRNVHDNFVAHLHALIPDEPETEPLGKDDSIEFLNVVFSLLHQLLEERQPDVENFSSQIFIILIGMLKSECIDEEVKLHIVKISEEWCRRKLLLYNSAIVNTFEFLLEISLKTGATKADVKRACGLRSAVKLENDIPKNRQLFLDAMRNVNYLTTREGCRFLTLILTLEEELTKEMHSVCKSFLPECSRNIAKSYGEIYYSAWFVTDGAMRKVIEEYLIQDLMERILKLKRQALEMSPLGQKVLTLLHAFHSHKSVTHVRTMLATLYEPLLWRNLKSPDTTIRSNAAEVFLDAYPLEKRGEGRDKTIEYTEKQHKIMTELLTDKCHIVRIIAVRHICQIASDFWQAIPPEVIQQWLSIVVTQLSRDSSCAEVRRSVFRGMRALVVNPLCAEYMQKVLSYLQDSIHDTNARVRTAFVELLVACKNDSSIKFWSIVPLNHLLARLEVDDREVGQKIVKLLFESFYPYEKGPEITLKRIMKMIVLSPIGCRKFFFYSKSVLSFDSCVQLVLSVITYILRHVRAQLAGNPSTSKRTEGQKIEKASTTKKDFSSKGNKTSKKRKTSSQGSTLSTETNESEENEETATETDVYFKTSLENPLISEIFIDIVSILLTVHNPKQHETEYKEQWQKIYAMCKMCMPEFLRYYKGTRTYNSILYLCTMMPRSVRKSIRPIYHLDSSCLSQLKSLPVHCTDEEVLRLVTILCAWNRGDELLEMTKNWIDEALRAEDLNSTRYGEPRPEQRKVKILDAREPNPLLGFRVLNAIFTYPPNNSIIMTKHYGQIVDIWKYLERLQKLIENRVERTSFFDNYLLSDEFIIECFSRYLKLIPNIKLGSENQSFDSVSAFKDILEWSEKVLISCLPKEFPLTTDDSTVEWVLIDTLGPVLVSLLNGVLKAAANFIMLNQTTLELTFKIIRHCKLLLRSGCRVMFVYSVCGVMCAITDKYKKQFKGKDLALLYSAMANLLVDCVDSFTDMAFTKDGLKQHVVNFSEARTSMINTLLTVSKLFGPSRTVFCKTLSRIITAITVIMTKDSKLLENMAALKKLQDLPYVASQLMISFYNNKSLSEDIFGALVKNISGEYREDPKQLLAAFGLLLLFIRYRRFISIESIKSALISSEAAVVSYHAEVTKDGTTEDDEILLEMMVDVLNEARTELTSPRNATEEEAAEPENAEAKDSTKSETTQDKAPDQRSQQSNGTQKRKKPTNSKEITEEVEADDTSDNGNKDCERTLNDQNAKSSASTTRSSKRRKISNELVISRKESEDIEMGTCEDSDASCKNKNHKSSDFKANSNTGEENLMDATNQTKHMGGAAVESDNMGGKEHEGLETPHNSKTYKSGISVTRSSSSSRRKVSDKTNLEEEMESDISQSKDKGGEACDQVETPCISKGYKSGNTVTRSSGRKRKVAENTNLEEDTERNIVDSEGKGGKECEVLETPSNNKCHESGNSITKSSCKKAKVCEKTNLIDDRSGDGIESADTRDKECVALETPRNSKSYECSDSMIRSSSRRRKVAEKNILMENMERGTVEPGGKGGKECDHLETPSNNKSHESGNSITKSSHKKAKVSEKTDLKDDRGDAVESADTGDKECETLETPHNSKSYECSDSMIRSSSRRRKVAEKNNLAEDMERDTVEPGGKTPSNNKSHESGNSITKSSRKKAKVSEKTDLKDDREDGVEPADTRDKECETLETPHNSKSYECSDSMIRSSSRRRKVAEKNNLAEDMERDTVESGGKGGNECDQSETPSNNKSHESGKSITRASSKREKVAEKNNLRESMGAATVVSADTGGKETDILETPRNNKTYERGNGITRSSTIRGTVAENDKLEDGMEENVVDSNDKVAEECKASETLCNKKSFESGNNITKSNSKEAEITHPRKKVVSDAVLPEGKEHEVLKTPCNTNTYVSANRRRKVAEITNLKKGTIEEIFELEGAGGKKSKFSGTGAPKDDSNKKSYNVFISNSGRRRLSEVTNLRKGIITEVTKSVIDAVKKSKELQDGHKILDKLTKPNKKRKP